MIFDFWLNLGMKKGPLCDIMIKDRVKIHNCNTIGDYLRAVEMLAMLETVLVSFNCLI